MNLKSRHIFYLTSAMTVSLIVSSCVPFGGSVGNSPVPVPNPTTVPTPTPIPTVTPIAKGWNSITSAPSVNGRANNVGFTSDQVGNLYLSYQGSESFAIYRYVFSQESLGWQQVASTQNMSLSSYNSSIAVSAISTINLTYLYSATPQVSGTVKFLTALPDKIDFANSAIPIQLQRYVYNGSVSPAPACPASIEYQAKASEATMTLDTSAKQIIALTDELIYESSVVNAESGTCNAAAYRGDGELSIFFAANATWYNKLSDGGATQIKIMGTPTAVGNKLPFYVAYKDAVNSGGVSVQKISYNSTSGVYDFAYVGAKGFNGDNANYISLAIDTNGVPYVAYESSNQLLAVQKFDGANWVAVGNSNITTGITTWVSLSMDIKTNTPYVAYQEGAYIKVKKFDGTNWIAVGGNIPNIQSNYGSYTNLIMRQESIDYWQPSLAFQGSLPGESTSSLSTLYYTP
ncbi:MAG: hypothetical protein K2X04_07465 [Burkholderiales bacterium]|nr:hypothetical protein [Burkholderiales bacterium]